jgi:hypothetical protein
MKERTNDLKIFVLAFGLEGSLGMISTTWAYDLDDSMRVR